MEGNLKAIVLRGVESGRKGIHIFHSLLHFFFLVREKSEMMDRRETEDILAASFDCLL
jgi:hypothetical protein